MQGLCSRCGDTHTFGHGVTPPKDWTCHKCQPAILTEEMARAPTSELISIIVEAAIEEHERGSHGVDWPTSRRRTEAASNELNARIPARPWWTFAG